MQYQVQFLDGLDNILREIKADARSAGTAFLRGASIAWPPHAMRVRVLDPYGRASVSTRKPSPGPPDWVGQERNALISGESCGCGCRLTRHRPSYPQQNRGGFASAVAKQESRSSWKRHRGGGREE
jgi:hypothetical protein